MKKLIIFFFLIIINIYNFICANSDELNLLLTSNHPLVIGKITLINKELQKIGIQTEKIIRGDNIPVNLEIKIYNKLFSGNIADLYLVSYFIDKNINVIDVGLYKLNQIKQGEYLLVDNQFSPGDQQILNKYLANLNNTENINLDTTTNITGIISNNINQLSINSSIISTSNSGNNISTGQIITNKDISVNNNNSENNENKININIKKFFIILIFIVFSVGIFFIILTGYYAWKFSHAKKDNIKTWEIINQEIKKKNNSIEPIIEEQKVENKKIDEIKVETQKVDEIPNSNIISNTNTNITNTIDQNLNGGDVKPTIKRKYTSKPNIVKKKSNNDITPLN